MTFPLGTDDERVPAESPQPGISTLHEAPSRLPNYQAGDDGDKLLADSEEVDSETDPESDYNEDHEEGDEWPGEQAGHSSLSPSATTVSNNMITFGSLLILLPLHRISQRRNQAMCVY